MRKKYLAYCLLLVELIIQIFGNIYYSQAPEFGWSLANAILIFIPLAFGIRLAMLCFLPVVVSEIVWFCILHAVGPLLHLVSFAVIIIFLSWAGKKLACMPSPHRLAGSIALYELSLIAEEALYRGLIMLFLHRPATWDTVSGTFLSPANPLLLLLLVFCCFPSL